MTIHVSVDEARKRLDELVKAAGDGKEVIIARGDEQVRMVPFEPAGSNVDPTWEQVLQRRMNVLGIWKDRNPVDVGVVPPSMTDQEIEERWWRKFGSPA